MIVRYYLYLFCVILFQNVLAGDELIVYSEAKIEISEARERNFVRWPEAGNDHTYEFEILQLKSWITSRTEWIDKNLDLLTTVSVNSFKPGQFSLGQNYPNPFNPYTHIKYQLSLSNKVELKVYDIAGREIRTLVDDLQKAGSYRVLFDGNDLPSGLYFYRLLTSTGFTETKKMLLVK